MTGAWSNRSDQLSRVHPSGITMANQIDAPLSRVCESHTLVLITSEAIDDTSFDTQSLFIAWRTSVYYFEFFFSNDVNVVAYKIIKI